MGKKKARNKAQKSHRVKLWSDLTGKPSRIKKVFPNHMSADFVKPRGGIAKDLHYDLNRSHIKSLSNNLPIPTTIISEEQYLAEAFVIPLVEVGRLKRNVVLRNGEVKKELWHEIKLEENDHRKLSLCFYAAKAIFIEVYKGKSIALSIPYSSTTKAMAFYKANAIAWGLHRPYATG